MARVVGLLEYPFRHAVCCLDGTLRNLQGPDPQLLITWTASITCFNIAVSAHLCALCLTLFLLHLTKSYDRADELNHHVQSIRSASALMWLCMANHVNISLLT
jgi:hypothetical protein